MTLAQAMRSKKQPLDVKAACPVCEKQTGNQCGSPFCGC
jgi:hypothetical protein